MRSKFSLDSGQLFWQLAMLSVAAVSAEVASRKRPRVEGETNVARFLSRCRKVCKACECLCIGGYLSTASLIVECHLPI